MTHHHGVRPRCKPGPKGARAVDAERNYPRNSWRQLDPHPRAVRAYSDGMAPAVMIVKGTDRLRLLLGLVVLCLSLWDSPAVMNTTD
jgi:hypothetical protein